MPPSTTSSQTRSAAFSPVCGRASIEFSILTASAGRSTGPSAGRPVRGQRAGGGGGGGVVVVGAAVLEVPGAAAGESSGPQAVRTASSTTAATAGHGRRLPEGTTAHAPHSSNRWRQSSAAGRPARPVPPANRPAARLLVRLLLLRPLRPGRRRRPRPERTEQPPAPLQREQPQQREDAADHPQHGVEQPGQDDGHLQRGPDDQAARPALHAAGQDQQDGEGQQDGEPEAGQARPALRDPARHEQDDDPLEDQHRGRGAVERAPGADRVRRRHDRAPESSVRASPAVTTLPVTSTPEPPRAPSRPASASAIADASASGSSGCTLTRSAPNTSTASAPSSSGGIARGELFWVTTSSAQMSSSAVSIPATSLPTTPPTT